VHKCLATKAVSVDRNKKVLPFAWFVAKSVSIRSYDARNDIDGIICSDIIRRHLAKQATSAAMVKPAGCDLP
jgi:hypothetical protein